MPRYKNFGKPSRKKIQHNRRTVERRIRFVTFARIHECRDIPEERPGTSNDDNFELSYEINNEETEPFHILGSRVVDIGYFMKQLQDIGSHSSMFNCNLGTVEFLSEKRTGLYSTFCMKCKMCGAKFILKSSNESENKMNINQEIVAGVMTIGAGFTQLNTLLCYINIPPISVRLYQSMHDTICQWWKKTADHCMAEAGKEEKNHALAIGSVDENGTPMIPVSGDACWSKRSYGTNYSASSGAGAIVGLYTKKVLYYGVKNKTCKICSRAQVKDIQPPTHDCFKNFNGPSTAMEAAIITEGFKSSLDSHGLIYNQYVADGDSSTYASIRNARPYVNVTVGKIECKNHLLRNYCKGLLAIASNTIYHIKGRKMLKENYLRIRWGIDSSVKYWTSKNIPFEQKVQNIKNDILNGPYHIFGDHSKCASYFCNERVKKRYENVVPELMAYGIFQKIEDLASRLSSHAYSLVHNITNNSVESFNARIAKFVGGKRVNYSQRGSYLARCAAAVISYNTGLLQSIVHKYIFDTEANPEIIKLEKISKQRNENRSRRNIKKRKNIRPTYENKDAYYGENCQKVDLNEKEFEESKVKFLRGLQLTGAEQEKLENDTVLQSGSPLWLETRRKLLTSSWFATVCKRRPTTDCRTLVKQILYGRDISNVPSIKHGRTNEQTAIRDLEKELKVPISQCGLFIDKEYPFLGASPDGKCQLGIVEVKCPSSAYGMEPEEAIKLKKVDFWLPAGNKFVINKKNKWYYQVQGQLRITGQDTCVFAIWTGPGKTKYELIEKDQQFWKEKMEPYLIRFYKNCLLPELIDPRHSRNMELRSHSSHGQTNILKIKN